MWRSTDQCDQVESEPEGNWSRRSKQPHNWDQITGRSSSSQSDHQYQIIDPIKTVEIDTYRPCPNYYSTPMSHSRASLLHHNDLIHQRPNSHKYSLCSPAHKAHETKLSLQPPLTPSPSKPKFNNLLNNFRQSVSPRYTNVKAERTRVNNIKNGGFSDDNPIAPNFMAATASASAKARSQSAPKQRPDNNLVATEIREKISTSVTNNGSARKRLSFPVQDESNGNGSLTCKNTVTRSHPIAVQQRRASVSYSRCSDSETSPLRNNHEQLRRWLR